MKEFVIEHIEKTMGALSAVASGKDEKGNAFPFQIGFVPERPSAGATTLVTVGLSERSLQQPDGTSARHEILMSAYQRFGKDAFSNLMKILGFVAKNILDRGTAVATGDFFDLGGPVMPGSSLSAVFLLDPMYFPEEARSIENIEPPVIFAWAVPITREEMLFARERGSEALSELFFDEDPDLMDLRRASLVT